MPRLCPPLSDPSSYRLVPDTCRCPILSSAPSSPSGCPVCCLVSSSLPCSCSRVPSTLCPPTAAASVLLPSLPLRPRRVNLSMTGTWTASGVHNKTHISTGEQTGTLACGGSDGTGVSARSVIRRGDEHNYGEAAAAAAAEEEEEEEPPDLCSSAPSQRSTSHRISIAV